MCQKCKDWEDIKILHPTRKRTSKCQKPWKFEGTNSHHRSKLRVAKCWQEIMNNNNCISIQHVPEQVVLVAEEVGISFGKTAASSLNPGRVNNKIHSLSPQSKRTPAKRKDELKRIRIKSPEVSKNIWNTVKDNFGNLSLRSSNNNGPLRSERFIYNKVS